MTRGIRIAVLGLMTMLWSAALLPAQYRQGGSWGGGRQQRWVQPDRSSYQERSNYREYTNYRNDDYGYRNRYNNNDRYNNDRYYNDRRGRSPGASAAIIAGSAGAGAAIGAVSGGGKGAAIGAVIGGVSGLIIDQTTKHRHH